MTGEGIGRSAGAAVLLALAAACSGATSGADGGRHGAPAAQSDVSLDVWLQTMEVGSREFYAAREDVLKAAAPKPGEIIADIGAGTGLYTLLFAKAVGPTGEVFAVDIEPRFLKLINQRAEDLDLGNVVCVLGRENSITLAPNSLDVAFISDTYSYFEDPAATMASVKAALRPGGRLYILDFNKPDGVAAPELQHVRLGRDGVKIEIESFGFTGGRVVPVPGLKETYMLEFRRP